MFQKNSTNQRVYFLTTLKLWLWWELPLSPTTVVSSCFGPEKVLAKESCWKISQIRKFITMELKKASETLFMHFFFMWVAKWSYATRQKLWNTDTGCQINVVFSLTVVFSFTFKCVLLLIAFLSLNVFWNAKKSTMSWLTCVRIFLTWSQSCCGYFHILVSY